MKYSTVKHALHCAFKGRGETPILGATQIVSDIEWLGVIVDNTRRNEPRYLNKCAQDEFTRKQLYKHFNKPPNEQDLISVLHWSILVLKYCNTNEGITVIPRTDTADASTGIISRESSAKYIALRLAERMKMDRPYLFLDYVKKWSGIDNKGFNKIISAHKNIKARQGRNIYNGMKGKPGTKHFLNAWLKDAEKEAELLLTSQDLLRYNSCNY